MIKLLGTNGQPVWLNPFAVEFVRQSESHTLIRLKSSSDLYVRESQEKVVELLDVALKPYAVIHSGSALV